MMLPPWCVCSVLGHPLSCFQAREYDRSKIQLILETAKAAVQEREAASIPRCNRWALRYLADWPKHLLVETKQCPDLSVASFGERDVIGFAWKVKLSTFDTLLLECMSYDFSLEFLLIPMFLAEVHMFRF